MFPHAPREEYEKITIRVRVSYPLRDDFVVGVNNKILGSN